MKKRFFLVSFAHTTGFVNSRIFADDIRKRDGLTISIISVQELTEQDAADFTAQV